MRAELEKLKSNAEVENRFDRVYSSQSTSNKVNHGYSIHTSGAVKNKADQFVTPMKLSSHKYGYRRYIKKYVWTKDYKQI